MSLLFHVCSHILSKVLFPRTVEVCPNEQTDLKREIEIMSMILKLQKALAANVNTNPQDVFAAKAFLQDQGHYTAPEWGLSQFPDRALFDAIKAFQKSNGLRVDGVMKPEGETEQTTQRIQADALNLQSMGRNGDTILAHITPDEAMMLKANGGAGTLNPKTGLLEFYSTYSNNRARDKAERDSSANRSKTSSTNNKNDGNGSNKNKDKEFSFARNFAEDLGNLFSGNWTGPHSAYDTRNANARADETGGDPKDYMRGGRYGPGGALYSASALHAAGVKAQATAARERTRQAQKAQNKESRADQYSALAKTDEDPNLDTQSTQARPTRSASLYGPSEVDQREAYGPPRASSAQQSAPAQTAQTAPAKRTPTPGVDPSWASSPDPKVQAQNVLNTNARREQEREDAKAKQRMDAGIADQRAKAKAKNPDKDYSEAMLKGAYQANRTAAHTAKTVRDLISRSNAISAKAQSQGLSLTPAQSLRHEIDKIRTQNKANAAKATQTKQARAVINLLAPTVIKALTAKPVAPVAAAAPTYTDDQIHRKITELKTKIHKTKPDFKLSYSAWKGAAMSALAAENNQPKAKAQIDKFIADQKQISDHKITYERTVKNQPNGYRNDGFIGQIWSGNNEVDWGGSPDDNISLGENNSLKSVTLNVDGPFRIEPTSVSAGLDGASITVDWYGRSASGNITPEYRMKTEDTNIRQHKISNLFGMALGSLDFAPPYTDRNPNGYSVTISKSGQPNTNGASTGMTFNIYSQKGNKPVTRDIR